MIVAKIPVFDVNSPTSGVSSFNAPIGVSDETLSFAAIQQALSNWEARDAEERAKEERAQRQQELDRQAQQGFISQSQAGPSTIVQPDSELDYEYQQAFRKRAYAVHQEQIKTDAQIMAARLSSQFPTDPGAFTQGWNEYTNTLVSSLRKQDPFEAEVASSYLKQLGSGFVLDIASRKTKEDTARHRADALNAIDQRVGAISDLLLNAPDEETAFSAIQDIYSSIDSAVDAGLLGPENAVQMKTEYHDVLIEENLRGEYRKAVKSNDVGALRGLVEHLQGGAYFQDNDRARRLADEFETTLKHLTTSRGDSVSMQLRALERYATAAELGGEVDQNHVQQLINTIMASGTPNQMLRAQDYVVSAEVLRQINISPAFNASTEAELDAFMKEMLSDPTKYPPSLMKSVSSRIEARKQELRDARNEGDVIALGGKINLDTLVNEGVGNAVQLLKPRQLAAYRAAGFKNIPVGAPLLSLDEIDQLNKLKERAMDDNDQETVNRIDYILNSTNGNIRSRSSGRSIVASYLTPLQASEFSAAVTTGKNTSLAALYKANPETREQALQLHQDADIKSYVAAMSQGNPEARSKIFQTVIDAFHGLVANGIPPIDAKLKVVQFLENAGDAKELKNGVKVMKKDLDKAGVPEWFVNNKIEDLIDDATIVGRYPSAFYGRSHTLVPRLLDDEGHMGIYYTVEGRFLTDPKTKEPYVINPSGVPAPSFWRNPVAFTNHQFEGVVSFAKQIPKKALANFDSDAVALNAAVLGTPKDIAKLAYGISRSYSLSDPDDVPDGRGRMFLPIGQQRPDEAPKAAIKFLNFLNEKYKGDKRKVLTAYLENEDTVDTLSKQFGDAWYKHVSVKTKKLIGKIEDNAERYPDYLMPNG